MRKLYKHSIVRIMVGLVVLAALIHVAPAVVLLPLGWAAGRNHRIHTMMVSTLKKALAIK